MQESLDRVDHDVGPAGERQPGSAIVLRRWMRWTGPGSQHHERHTSLGKLPGDRKVWFVVQDGVHDGDARAVVHDGCKGGSARAERARTSWPASSNSSATVIPTMKLVGAQPRGVELPRGHEGCLMPAHDVLSAANDHVSEATVALGGIADGFCSETGLLVRDLITARERLEQMSAAVEVIASGATVLTKELQTVGAIPFQRAEADDAFASLRQEHARLRPLLEGAFDELVDGARAVAPFATRRG